MRLLLTLSLSFVALVSRSAIAQATCIHDKLLAPLTISPQRYDTESSANSASSEPSISRLEEERRHGCTTPEMNTEALGADANAHDIVTVAEEVNPDLLEDIQRGRIEL